MDRTVTWLETIVANVGGGHYREETLEGRTHLVVNGAILAEDVIEGNQGPIFYPDVENAAAVPQWDHMPIVLDHPASGSARTVEYLNANKLGVVLNTAHDAKARKVRPEFWFDKDRTKELAPTIYEKILNKQPVETSSGLKMALVLKPGKFNNKEYAGVATKQQPDHVAVLPKTVGAYSVAMGGGIFANAAPDLDTGTRTVLARTLAHCLNSVSPGETEGFVLNELSFDQIFCQLAKKLSAQYGEPGRYWDGWLESVYPTYVVFADGKGKTWKQEYTASDSGVTLTGKAVEVVRTVSYTPVTNAAPANVTNQKETQTVDKTTIIDDLVKNQGYAEADKAWMNKLEADELKQLPSKKVVANTAATVPPPPPTPAPAVTLQQLVANADPATQAVFADMVSTHNAEKAKLVEKITKAPGNTFRAEDLGNMAVQNLRMIAGLIPDAPVQNAAGFNLAYPLQPAFGGIGGPISGLIPVANQGGTQANNAAPQVPVLSLPTADSYLGTGGQAAAAK